MRTFSTHSTYLLAPARHAYKEKREGLSPQDLAFMTGRAFSFAFYSKSTIKWAEAASALRQKFKGSKADCRTLANKPIDGIL